MTENNTKKNKKSPTSMWRELPNFLKVLTKVITGITGLIVAIVGLYNTVLKPILIIDHSPYIVEVKSLNKFPFSLKNSIGQVDFLYWSLIQAQNQSREPLHIEVSFELRQPELAEVSAKPAIYTVNPKEKFSQSIDPGFEFKKNDVSADVNDDLNMTWKVSDEKENLLKWGTNDIRLLPKNILYWDMKTPKGEDVPKDFLIASLSAWVQTPYPRVKTYAMQLLSSIKSQSDPLRFANQWFAKCYDEFFGRSSPIRISPNLIIQMKGEQTIRLPSQILMERNADPLEIILLLSALSRSTFENLGLRLVMFVITEDGDISYLLGWAVKRCNDWRALDMTDINKMKFANNMEQATSKIRNFLEEHPEIIELLDSKGVFLDEKQLIIALDFSIAAKYYHIRSLP